MRELRCDGSEHEQLSRRLAGPAAAPLRPALRPLSAEERARWAADELERVMAAGALPRSVTQVAANGLEDAERPLEIHSRFSRPPRAGPPWELRDDDPWLAGYARALRAPPPPHGWLFDGIRVRSRIVYRICDAWRVAFPGAALDFQSDWGHLRRTWDAPTRDGIALDTELDLPRSLVAPEDVPRFQRFLDRSLGASGIRLQLAPAPAAAPDPEPR